MLLHDFPGGLRLPGHKEASLAQGIQRCPLSRVLKVPLRQHAGPAAQPIVAVGDAIRRGQCLATAKQTRSVAVHAPASGVVQDIVLAALPGPDPTPVAHLVIATANDADALLPTMDWQRCTPDQLLQRLRDAGLAGLGGAGFSSADKLATPRSTLILNGAECEPYIACDEALLRERADQVVLGGRLLARIIDAERIVLALEDDMHEAFLACQQAVRDLGAGQIELLQVPNRYPQGGERQLIHSVTGCEVPRGGLPGDLGILVHNVGTAAAAWQAVSEGEPLIRRIVTVAGSGVRNPGNYEVALGTSIADLIEAAGGYTEHAQRLLIGGPLMGWSLPHDDFAIGKTSNCVLVLGEEPLRDPRAEMPCIRCGDCATVCPARLLPQLLLNQVRQADWPQAQAQGLSDCIECGACDLVCPSVIPLTGHFRYGKASLQQQARERANAEAARQRHLARQQRLVREESQQSHQRATRANDAASKDAVAAALERARVRRQNKDQDKRP